MTISVPIPLKEYKTQYFPSHKFDEDFEKVIWQQYRKYVDITPPSWRNDQQWELRPSGWVGYIPVTNEITLFLEPKVSIANLFQMLEIAYRLDFEVIPGLYDSQTLDEFYEKLAKILALKVLDRKKRGLYRKYVNRTEDLPFVRGRVQLQEIYRKPWQVKMPSRFQEHTPDISDNQLFHKKLMCVSC